MRSPAAFEGRGLLDLCDADHALSPTGRGVALLLAAGSTPLSPQAVEAFDIGSFHLRLLDLCAVVLGERLAGRARCPVCAAALDVALDIALMRQAATGASADTVLEAAAAGAAVRFRLPRAGDLLGLTADRGVDAARRALLEACVVSLSGADTLSEALMAAMSEAMVAQAAQADLRVPLSCAACGHDWEATLDAGAFLWSELEFRAERLAEDVHGLAQAYGWSEADILALSPARRRRYLSRVAA